MQIRDVECRNQRLQRPKKMGTGLKDYSVLNLTINGMMCCGTEKRSWE